MPNGRRTNALKKRTRAFPDCLALARDRAPVAEDRAVPSDTRAVTRRTIGLWTLGVLALSASGISYAVGGQLLDTNGNRVADAWVVATREECIGFAHCTTFCREVRVAQTDARGRYAFQTDRRPASAYWLSAYREGYIPAYRLVGLARVELVMARGGHDRSDAHLGPVTGRLTHLERTARHMACITAPIEQRAALVPVYKAMYREATGLARSEEQSKVLKQLCRNMYSTQMRRDQPARAAGADEAHREAYLDTVEPACNEPMDHTKDDLIRWAIENDDFDTIRRLVRRGLEINRHLNARDLPIVVAARKGSAEMVRELVRAGARVDEVGVDSRTALEHAIWLHQIPRARHLSVLEALLEAGADPNRAGAAGYPPLAKVAKHRGGDVAAFLLLLRYGAPIDEGVTCRDCLEEGYTVLHLARDPALLRVAIEHGADVNARASDGMTPLMLVSSPEAARLLLDAGAEPNVASEKGWTPLAAALSRSKHSLNAEDKSRYVEVAEMLVLAGARLEPQSRQLIDPPQNTPDEAWKKRRPTYTNQR